MKVECVGGMVYRHIQYHSFVTQTCNEITVLGLWDTGENLERG